jgi:hypothetical protein
MGGRPFEAGVIARIPRRPFDAAAPGVGTF